jgi:hypothetical protein
MVGTVAQLLSLVSYGNEFITKHSFPLDYFPNNPVFQYDKEVVFDTSKEKFFGGTKAIHLANPQEWFRWLKEDGCLELRAIFQYSDQKDFKDYMMAGMVGGGGTWFVQSSYKRYCDLWYANWEVGNQNDPDNKIWLVKYKTVLQKQEIKQQLFLLNPIKEELGKLLIEIEAFARTNKKDMWADWFKKALESLNSNKPYESFYQQNMIVLKNYSLLAQQVLFGASNAWVFGGMGSWNDIGFAEKETNVKYEQLSEQLYDVMIRGLVGAINSY